MEDHSTTDAEPVTEATPLLAATSPEDKKQPTPLPKLQLAIVIFLQIGEPLSSQSIYPYINQLIRELDVTGGDDRKIGYYAGLIESLFFATEAMTVLHWSRLSDRIGRKPVLLLGLFGSMVSMLCFGLSRTFGGLVVSRCLTGLLNGNIGVMKSVMGDLTDGTNRAEAFALLTLVWTIGCTAGPLLGGSLYHPYERFPDVFTAPFWKEYPYFLPCLVTAGYLALSWIVTLVLFKETVKPSEKPRSPESPSNLVNGKSSPHNKDADAAKIPLRSLMTYPVLLSLTNYAFFAFLHICMYALLPLFLAMPVGIGGLGLEPATIGIALGAYGLLSGSVQTLIFARLVRYFGPRTMFLFSLSSFIPVSLFFPATSLVAKAGGMGMPVWGSLVLMLLCLGATDMGYGSIFMYITSSAPSKRALGATNGLSQMSVSVARAIGPALATSSFSFSVQQNILGGYGLYPCLTTLTVMALMLASRLPLETWPEKEEEN